jgi:hypothetical protein
MPYFAVLRQYEFNNLEIIISQRKKPFIVVLQLLMYNKTVKNRLFREVASLLSPSTQTISLRFASGNTLYFGGP